MTKDENLALIADALHAALTARIEHDKRCADAPRSQPIKLVRFTDYDATRSRLEGIISNPVHAALRKVMHDLGKELFKLVGSTDAMLKVCNEVATRTPSHEGRCLSIIDHAWNGIGDDHDRWWS
jgi:hypothetical protein